MKKNKVGRNQRCPCGSGKKYKKCHWGKEGILQPETMEQSFEELIAKEQQRKEQQGLGREIISTVHQGVRFVAVGSQVLYPKDKNKKWRTFHDFLNDYIKGALGAEWGDAELKKDSKLRHPIIRWYNDYCELQQKNIPKEGEVVSMPHIGASIAYLGLAYNLYLLHHNKGVQTELIRRLKLNDVGNFYGAVYETYVAAHFVKAGFDIEFENELDGNTSHCEFTATHKKSGRQFSVEAKAIAPNRKGTTGVVNRLNKALEKQANHERIIFIDMGKPASSFEESKPWLKKAQGEIRKHEANPVLNGKPLPKAYVVITNHSYWHDLKGRSFHFSALGEGFQIPNFKDDYKDTIKNGLKAREQHKEIFDLIQSMHKHRDIPSTFDGENPALAFGKPDKGNSPLIIGHKYLVPVQDGKEVPATLQIVNVDEEKKIAIGVYQIDGGGSTICSCPLSDAELEGYKKHPHTFFGKVTRNDKLEDPLEFYDWVHSMYRDTPKEKLLEFMAHYPNRAELEKLTQEQLLNLYCESVTEWASRPSK